MTFSRIEHLAEGVTLYLGDCREILPSLPKVDAVVTDPPYGIAKIWQGGFNSKYWGHARTQLELRNSWDAIPPTASFLRLLSSLGPTIIWGGNHFELTPSRGWLIWRKEVNPAFTLGDAELAWSNLDRPIRAFDHMRMKGIGNEHPTQKPIQLMKWCIQQLPPARTILDPFMGSGTTGVAAVKLGRKFIGIEIEEKYFAIACRRVGEALKQPDLFIEKPKPAEQEVMNL